MTTKSIISKGIFIVILLTTTSAVAQILPEDPSRGGQLFVSKGCMKCHAVEGKGGRIGPDLGIVDPDTTQLELAAELWNHTPTMIVEMAHAGIDRPTLTGQEFTDLTSYLYFLRFFDKPGDAESGEYEFNQKGCRYCHLVSGRSVYGGPGLDEFPRNASPVFMCQVVWNHSRLMMASMLRNGKEWGTFSENEMIDVLAYIKTQAKGPEEPYSIKPNPKAGRAVYLAKGCTKCHSVHGEGAKNGIDLGKRAEANYTSMGQIATKMWNKAPEMFVVARAPRQDEVPQFTADEMTNLLAYLYFLHYTDEPGNASRGEKIFSNAGCAQCHGLAGKRGTLMYVDLSKYQNSPQIEIVANIWNHSIQMREATIKKGIPWPHLKKGEMADLLEYIRTPVKN